MSVCATVSAVSFGSGGLDLAVSIWRVWARHREITSTIFHCLAVITIMCVGGLVIGKVEPYICELFPNGRAESTFIVLGTKCFTPSFTELVVPYFP